VKCATNEIIIRIIIKIQIKNVQYGAIHVQIQLAVSTFPNNPAKCEALKVHTLCVWLKKKEEERERREGKFVEGNFFSRKGNNFSQQGNNFRLSFCLI